MKNRILCLGLVAVVTQLFGTGCLFHPVARWRANHPCGACGPCHHYHPLLHPVQTRRAVLGEPSGAVATVPPCHGCNSSSMPVSFSSSPGPIVPTTNTPTIGYPMPLTPGPTVIPSYELPSPMPMKPAGK